MGDMLLVCGVWVVGFGVFALVSRRFIALHVSRWKLPLLVKYYLVLTPVIWLEEILTIQGPYFWNIIPITISFYIVFLILFLFQRYTRTSFVVASLGCGVLGWFTEFLANGMMRTVLAQYGPTQLPDAIAVLTLMSLLGFWIYVVMAILPASVLQYEMERRGIRKLCMPVGSVPEVVGAATN